ncbi:hypothetical protein ACLOJK_026874, partial [Asimina triloba]
MELEPCSLLREEWRQCCCCVSEVKMVWVEKAVEVVVLAGVKVVQVGNGGRSSSSSTVKDLVGEEEDLGVDVGHLVMVEVQGIRFEVVVQVGYMIFDAPPEHLYGAPSPSPRPAVMAVGGELQLDVRHGCRTHHHWRQLHLPDVSSTTDSGRQRRPRADARPPPSAIFSIQQISITDPVATHHQPTNPSTVLLPSRSSSQAPLSDASQASS